ncbi:MAG: pro-sigmaK processing inhibitor BofA family protein [Gorillibacterium sp.]|nr:pro-sigmaK processing inhibitor BofA family protein [Gorillibacterium sp.]
MHLGLWVLFVGSLLLLLILLVRNRYSTQVLAKIGMVGVCSVLLLYAANWVGGEYIHLPINGVTVTAVGVLGIPGLALLVAVQSFVL